MSASYHAWEKSPEAEWVRPWAGETADVYGMWVNSWFWILWVFFQDFLNFPVDENMDDTTEEFTS